MPLYDYVCAACGRRFEVIHGVHGDPPEACPLCGQGPVRKVITAATVHYKGSGWAKKERRAGIRTGSSSGGGEEDGSEAAASGPDKGSPSKGSDPSPAEPGSGQVPAAATADEAPRESSKRSKGDAPSTSPAKTVD